MSLKWLLLSFLLLGLSACARIDDKVGSPEKGAFLGHPQIDDLEPYQWAQGEDGKVIAVASDKNQNVWIAINIQKTVDKPARAFFRVSDNAGAKGTWKNVGESDGPTHEGLSNNAIAMDTTNDIYVAQTFKKGSNDIASVHYSKDGGKTWKDIPYEFADGGNQSLQSAFISPTGQPYFAGTYLDSNGVKTGFVLTLVDDKLNLVGSSYGEFRQGAFDPQGHMFLAGSFLPKANTPQWLVLKSDGAMALAREPEVAASSVPSFFKSSLGSANVVAVTAGGVIYIGGSQETGGSAWVIKTSTDLGTTYADSDDLQAKKKASHLKDAVLNSIYTFNVPVGTGISSYIFAAGSATDLLGGSHWLVRVLEPKGRWHNMYTSKEGSEDKPVGAVGIASVSGNRQLIVVGDSYDENSNHRILVKKISEAPFNIKK